MRFMVALAIVSSLVLPLAVPGRGPDAPAPGQPIGAEHERISTGGSNRISGCCGGSRNQIENNQIRQDIQRERI